MPIPKSSQSEMYEWGMWLPNSDAETGIYLEVQNKIVTAIGVTQDLFPLFFPALKPLDKFSNINPTALNERFKGKNNQCIEMSKNACK